MTVAGVPDKRLSKLERMEVREHAASANGNGARPKPQMTGRGSAGAQLFAGYISTDEYVPELTWPRSIATYDKMRRSDGMVRATTRALTMPLLAAQWDITPGTTDPSDVEIADLVRDGLFSGMTMTWKRTLREALTSLPFGHAVMEKRWELRAGDDGKMRVMPRKLLPIKQSTISRFNVEDDGGLRSVHQQQRKDGRYLEEELPIETLLVFVNEQEGADWLGQSVLRSGYKHWWIADQLARIQAIAAERHGVGIPMVELPADEDDPVTIAYWEEILSQIRVNERGYIVATGGAKPTILGMGDGRALDVLPMIQHHNRMTAVSVLADFLTLGGGDVGSWALSNDKSSLFLMALQSVGDEAAAVFNQYLIKPWVDYNYSGVRKYPELTVANIETRNGDKLVTAVGDAIQKGAITYDRELEDALRDLMSLPELPEQDVNAPSNVPVAGDPGTEGAPAPAGTPIPSPTPAAPFRIAHEDLAELRRLARRDLEPIAQQLATIAEKQAEFERRPEPVQLTATPPDPGAAISSALEPLLEELRADRADRAELVRLASRRTRTVREKHFELGELNGQVVVTGGTETEREEDE